MVFACLGYDLRWRTCADVNSHEFVLVVRGGAGSVSRKFFPV